MRRRMQAMGWGLVAVLVLGLTGMAGAVTTVRRVDSADGSCNSSGPVYCLIQDAIDDSSAGDTVYVKFGTDGTYTECILIDLRINVVAGGDVTIDGGGDSNCGDAPTVGIFGPRARFQGFTVINPDNENHLIISGTDNIVAANRFPSDDCQHDGIRLVNGAARNLVVANVLNVCDIGIYVDDDAGPNNQLLHNVASGSGDGDGIRIEVSKTTLVGNATTFNHHDGIVIRQDCNSPKITQTALSKNVSAQNNQHEDNDHFDIRMDPRAQRPVLRGNTYQNSGVVSGC